MEYAGPEKGDIHEIKVKEKAEPAMSKLQKGMLRHAA